jgi:hypothetical protein
MIVQKLQLALIFVTEYIFSIEDKEKVTVCIQTVMCYLQLQILCLCRWWAVRECTENNQTRSWLSLWRLWQHNWIVPWGGGAKGLWRMAWRWLSCRSLFRCTTGWTWCVFSTEKIGCGSHMISVYKFFMKWWFRIRIVSVLKEIGQLAHV